jgi:hypothetical protein
MEPVSKKRRIEVVLMAAFNIYDGILVELAEYLQRYAAFCAAH